MKVELVSLMAVIAFSTSPVIAGEKFQVAEVEQVLANPDQYRGLTVALHGVVDKVTLERKTFSIIDSKSGSTARHSLMATIRDGSQVIAPNVGQETVFIGQVEKKDGVANFMATQVFTNRAEVQQLLAHGSITRTPGKRPGDNLGRDAQPSRDQ